MKLITRNDLLAYLDNKSDNTHDTLLDTIIDGVSQRIETFLRRKLTEEERTEVFDGGRKRYLLPAYPIDTGQDITIDIDGVTSFVEDTDYFVWPEMGMIEFSGKISNEKPRILSITWTGGYALTEGSLAVPDDIKRVCIMQCAFEFRRRRDMGISSVSSPDGNITVNRPAALLPEVVATLQPYAHRRIG